MSRLFAELAARARSYLTVRPQIASFAALALVPAVLAAVYAPSAQDWAASPDWDGASLLAPRVALLFEGNIVSGEGAELLLYLSSGREVQASWLSTGSPDGITLSSGPPEVQRGRAVIGLPSGGYGEARDIGESLAAQFPTIAFLAAEPWAYEPSPPVSVRSLARGFPLVPSFFALMLVFYPVMETYSRLKHLLRAAFVASVVTVSSWVGILAALAVVAWLTASGAGHHSGVFVPTVLGSAVLAASMPPFWVSRLEAERYANPSLSGASAALGMIAPVSLLMLIAGSLLTFLAPSSVFSASGTLVLGVAVASLLATVLSSAVIILAGLRPVGAVVSPSAMSVGVLLVGPFFSRILSHRALSALAAGFVLAGSVLLLPPAPEVEVSRPASVLVEVAPVAGARVGEVEAAEVVARAAGSGVFARAYELFDPDADSRLLLAEVAPLSAVEALVPGLSYPGAAVRVVGGSFSDWSAWSDSFALSILVAGVSVILAFVAAAAFYFHSRFYISRASLILAAVGLSLVPLMLSDASGFRDPRSLAVLIPTLFWCLAFGTESAREMDSGADGATATASAAALSLPLLVPPATVLLASDPAVFGLLAGAAAAAFSVALVASVVLGPRESLRA